MGAESDEELSQRVAALLEADVKAAELLQAYK